VAHRVEFVVVVLVFLRLGLLGRGLGHHGSFDFAHGGALDVLHFGGLGLVRSLALAAQVLLSVVCIQHFEHLVGAALVGGLQQHVHIHCELNCVAGRARPKVVLASLEARSPRVEVHVRHLVVLWVGLVQIQRLRLANEGSTANRQVDQVLLLDFPNRFVQLLDVGWDLRDILDRAVISHNLILDFRGPQIQSDQIAHQVLVDADKLARKHTTRVNVGREGFKGFIVAENLRG